jgi:hypothetical protein
MSAFFPLPQEHAIHVLASCGDDLVAARLRARENARHAPTFSKTVFSYWLAIANSLRPDTSPERWN